MNLSLHCFLKIDIYIYIVVNLKASLIFLPYNLFDLFAEIPKELYSVFFKVHAVLTLHDISR